MRNPFFGVAIVSVALVLADIAVPYSALVALFSIFGLLLTYK